MGQGWHGYVYKKNHTRFSGQKILVPAIATGSCFALDLEGSYYFVGSGGGGGGGYGIRLQKDQNLSCLCLLGLLNSRLLSSYLRSISTSFRGGYLALNRQYIEQLPIHPINFSDKSDKAKHAKMIALVERMMDLHGRLTKAKAPDDKTKLQRQIDATDREIDRLVYDLYGLTEEEIGIVEGKAS
jgi:hypothetical protein